MSAGEPAGSRRERLIRLASAAGFLSIVALAVMIVVSESQTEGGDTALEGVDEVVRELRGIPQRGLVIGEERADVTLIEFGDLQCPACKGYAEDVLPEVVDSRVRSGVATIEFRPFTIVDDDSTVAAAAAIAAGRQGRGWSYVALFYRNQGIEASGYVTDDFLAAIARAAGVSDLRRWNRDRRSPATLAAVSRSSAEAERLGFTGTPSFAVVGPGTDGPEPLGTPGSAGELEAAIDAAR